MLPRPSSCSGCPLDPIASGFAPPDGPEDSWILFLGEALGATEAATGKPFMGDAGGMLQRILNLLGWNRSEVRIANTISCFPGETLVLAPGVQHAFKREYTGVITTITTEWDRTLTGTPNHPVLTSRGWVPLDEIQIGDYLLRYRTWDEWATMRDPNIQDMPPTIAQVFGSAAVTGVRRRMISRLMDFHGDGCNSQIDVVAQNRVLGRHNKSAFLQRLLKNLLAGTHPPSSPLGSGEASLSNLLRRTFPMPQSQMGRSQHAEPIQRGSMVPSERHGGGAVTYDDSEPLQGSTQSGLSNTIPLSELLNTYSAFIETTKVSKIERTTWSGHVYNLETSSHVYVANGYIVHNCRPPHDWFDERAPYYKEAIHHCQVHRDPVLAGSQKVVVPLGAVAAKTILNLHGHRKVRIQDLHGSPIRDPHDRFWVVPTFHPSFLQRGAHNLLGTVIWDLQQAKHVAIHGQAKDPATLIIDPPIEWFTEWVSTVCAAVAQDPTAYPLSVDVETPDKAGGKDEGEITAEDQSYQILRVNVACHPDEGITVPFEEPYIEQLKRLMEHPILWMWNGEYDFPRLVAAGVLDSEARRRVIDLMWLWHFLQSDLPRGLGFAAPFYSSYGPWKHLSDSNPGLYAAIDALQNHRCGFGIVENLIQSGQYAQAIRHVHALHSLVLAPAQRVGVRIDREKLLIFKEQLGVKLEGALGRLQECYPEDLLPTTPEAGLTARPLENVLHVKATAFTRKGKARKGKASSLIKQDLYKKAIVVERLLIKEVFCCSACGEKEVHRKHRCKAPYTKQDGTVGWKNAPFEPKIELQPCTVTRWFWQEPFNPDSWQQVLDYIKYKGHTPGKAKKTHKDSTNRESLEKLERTTGDGFYRALLDYRAVAKVKGTYVDGTERLLDQEDRVHPIPTFKPSTMRLSYTSPNITNVVADKGGQESLAAGFRHCVVAGPGCRLLEADFSGIEAVETGWYAKDPAYVRLAKLGVHAGLASHVLKRPYDLGWSDQDLAGYFKEIKNAEPTVYDRAKRFIHGKNYGLTLHGMVLQFPQFFPNLKVAAQYADIFRGMAPNVEGWQRAVRELAQKQHYLGGKDHPFGYKHWFWSVHTFKKITPGQYHQMLARAARKGGGDDLPVVIINDQPFKVGLGDDGKRCLAFFPQSTAAGVLKESLLRLFDPDSPSYIGDAYFGQTPLRAPIHDSMLLEVPHQQWDRVYEAVCREMLRPIAQQPMPEEWNLGPYLTIGIAAKAGSDWGTMKNIQVPNLEELGVAGDSIWSPADEDEDDEDRWGLQRIVA